MEDGGQEVLTMGVRLCELNRGRGMGIIGKTNQDRCVISRQP